MKTKNYMSVSRHGIYMLNQMCLDIKRNYAINKYLFHLKITMHERFTFR